MNLEKYRSLFIEEANDHLAQMSQAVVTLEKQAPPSEQAPAIDCLFRMAHSIKGMAASLDYEPVSTLAHRLEDWLEPCRDRGAFPPAAFGLLYEVLGALEQMVADVAGSDATPEPRPDLVEALGHPLAFDEEEPAPPASTGPAPAPAESRAPPLPASVRVRTETVDRFLAAVGELMQCQARLERLHSSSGDWDERREFGEELERMEDVVRELRRRALDIRTTPVRRVLERLPRVATELARALGKRVEVELHGDEVEVDRAVLDHVDDPLLHLVRNAVDHGLEAPERREHLGKSPVGKIRVSAERRGSRVHFRLEEDGSGIDAEAVRNKAVERGLLLDAVAEDLPIERVCELIFEAGMSTRGEVTEVSGRGVGLDAVKRTIEGLGGTISVDTAQGTGTAFEIDLPSMVALQRVLVLEVGEARVALPVSAVERVLSLDEGIVEGEGDEAFFVWNDEPLPLLDLARRLGLESSGAEGSGTVVLIDVRGFRLGLRVARAADDLEVFVREVPPALRCLEPLGGVAILPDGVPIFLMEVGALVEAPA